MRRFRISHRTSMVYDQPVRASHNEIRMTPLAEPGQTTLDNRIKIRPLTWSMLYRDHWDTHVTALECLDGHDRLDIESISVVERTPVHSDEATVGWAGIVDPSLRDLLYEWLMFTPRTKAGAGVDAIAARARNESTPRDAAEAVCEMVRQAMTYEPGATGVQSSGEQAWEARRGVCQDFAHVTLGALRTLGIPARYVSGYLSPRRDAEVGESSAGESHAWIEYWDGAWRPADPTNGVPVGLDHIIVARGRDYEDVPPLKGVYSGPGLAELSVEVRFTRLA